MNRRSALATALALLALAGCDQKPAGSGKTLQFSVQSVEDAKSVSSYWQPVIDDMRRKTGLDVKLYFASSYALLIQAMAAKQTDLGWFSAQPAVEATERANAEVFARTLDQFGRGAYQSVIIAQKGKGMTVDRLLKCDKTLKFGMGDPESTSGTLAPMYYLFRPRGVDPRTCFAQVTSANHQANMLSVANGLLDAATNNSTGLLFYRTGSPEARAAVAKTEVIWSSPDIPESALLFRKDLDEDAKRKIRDFFFSYGRAQGAEGDRERANLARLKYSEFAPADASYLQPIVEMRRAAKSAAPAAKPRSPPSQAPA